MATPPHGPRGENSGSQPRRGRKGLFAALGIVLVAIGFGLMATSYTNNSTKFYAGLIMLMIGILLATINAFRGDRTRHDGHNDSRS